MRRSRAAVIALLLLVRPAAAGFLCDTLGVAGQFTAVAEESLETRVTSGFSGQPVGSRFDGTVCTTRARLQAADVGGYTPFGDYAPVVAVASAGTALRILPFRGEGTTAANQFEGDLVTGGGAVAGTPTEHFGVVDASGTNPVVDACRDAFVAARAASATLAALAPTQTLGRVYLRRDETLVLDGRGGAVFQLDALITQASGGRYAGYDRLCFGIYDEGHVPPTLEIVGDPGDQIVINVGRFALGSCTVVNVRGVEDVVVNVPGRGRKVTMGYGTGGGNLGDQLAILAPERTFRMDAGTDDDDENRVVAFWARRARLDGNTQVVDTGLVGCPAF